MFLKTFVYQFQGYLTDYRKNLLKGWYGLAALRNVMFVKPDNKLYFIDNNQAEVCLSHPDFSQVQNAPTGQGVDTWDELQGKPLVFPPESHDHDDRYYTETEVDTALAGKSDTGHTHGEGGDGLVLVSGADATPDYLGAKLLAGDDISITESEIGPGYKQLGIAGGPNLLRQTSSNRPGVTKLYRRDNDSGYNLQFHDDGSSRWFLRAYNGDTLHGYPVRVENLGGFSATDLKSAGTVVQRTSDLSIGTATHTAISWNSVLWNTAAGANGYWNGNTRLTTARAGWHIVFGLLNLNVNTNNTQFIIRVLRGGNIYLQQNFRKASDTSNIALTISGFAYLSANEYVELTGFSQAAGFVDTSNFNGLFGLVSLEA